MAHHDGGSYDIPAHLNSLNEELKVQLRETQSKLASSDVLLTEKGNQSQLLEWPIGQESGPRTMIILDQVKQV